VNQLQLNELVHRIEGCFGEELPVTGEPMSPVEQEVLDRLIQGEAYQAHAQDQFNRQVIRDYLVNAVVLGAITDENFSALSKLAQSIEGRASLSLYMLMSSVDAANDLLPDIGLEDLKELRPESGSRPHMVIVGGG
jgi:hypothetical protein